MQENDPRKPIETPEDGLPLPDADPSAKFELPGQHGGGRKRLIVWLLILLLLLLGLAGVLLFVWPGYLMQQQAANAPAGNTAPGDTPTAMNTVLYAYKEGKTTTVRKFNVTDSAKTDVFTFEELREAAASGNYYEGLSPAVDFSASAKAFAYSTKDGLWTRNTDGQNPAQLITATAAPSDIDPAISAYTYNPEIGEPDTTYFGLYDPVWSADGTHIGFTLGHYEGGSADAIKVATKTYVAPGDTFRYIGEEKLQDKFTINADNAPLKTAGVLPHYLVDPSSVLHAAALSPDKTVVYALLCPSDLPDSGNSKYIGEVPLDGRDCGEPQQKSLIKITLADGSYQTIATGYFMLQMLQAKTADLYVPLGEADKFAVQRITPATGEKKTFDVVTAAKVTPGASTKVLGTRVDYADVPIATVFVQTGETYTAHMVDIEQSRFLGTLDLAKVSAFKPLALQP